MKPRVAAKRPMPGSWHAPGMQPPMGGGGGYMPYKRMRGGEGGSLEEENEMLRRENSQLRQKVLELTATNKFLLEQNAEVRIQQTMSGAGAPMSGTISYGRHYEQRSGVERYGGERYS